MAFAPDYVTSGEFYVQYTAEPDGRSRVSEFTVSGSDPDLADANSEEILVSVSQPASNHNGGALAFGFDGFLYVAIGDGGGGGDTFGNGQNKDTILGSILRIQRNGDPAPGNPFIGVGGDDRIWAWGLRNPWRIALDPATGDIWVGDVGQDRWEEVDRIPSGVGGVNFGWNTREGNHCFSPAGGCTSVRLTPPVLEYAHGADPCSGSITGGVMYRGNDIPKLRGHYFYADFCKQFIRSFRFTGGQAVDTTSWTGVFGVNGGVTTFGTDGYGEMYIATSSTVYQVVSNATPPCDFNSDGFEDLPVGVPGEGVGAVPGAGAIQVFYGSDNGLKPTDDDGLISQDTPGIVGNSRTGDRFGAALACADFNGDGFADLAIGVPGKKIGGSRQAGAVAIIPGSANGLDTSSSVRFHQDAPGVNNKVEKFDRFGSALATGDFNRDGHPDLAVGVPGEAIGGVRSGAVAVFLGGGSLRPKASDRLYAQARNGLGGVREAGDLFGHALAAGDFDGDGDDDLAIGIPGEPGGGAIQILKGKPSGLVVTPQLRSEPGVTELGAAVASGATNLDGFDDVIAGAPGTASDAGAVVIFGGRLWGIAGTGQSYRQGDGLWNVPESGDRFGDAVATGDVTGNGLDDLLIGVPGEDNSGLVHVLFAGVDGPSTLGDQLLKPGGSVPGVVTDYTSLGAALALRDVDGDGDADVFAGDPGLGGQILAVPSENGLRRPDTFILDQDTVGVPDVREADDEFGAAL